MNENRRGRLEQLFDEMPDSMRDMYRESGESAIGKMRPLMNVLLDRRLRPLRTEQQIWDAVNACYDSTISHIEYSLYRSEVLEESPDPLREIGRFLINDPEHQFAKLWLSSAQRPELLGLLVESVRTEMRSLANRELEIRRREAMTSDERRVQQDNEIREIEQFHRRRMQYMFEIASNREHELSETARDQLRVEAKHGNLQAAELLRRLEQ